jgi:nitroreductase
VAVPTWEAIRSRRNVRSYSDVPIAGDHLDEILEAGRRAPSSQNWQPWDFVVVTDRSALVSLSGVQGHGGAEHVASAAAAVCVVAAEGGPDKRLYFDLGQAVMSMMLAAAGLKIGSCHAGVADQDLARTVLGLPDDRFCAFVISFGYPADRELTLIRHPTRRPFDEVVHRDKWLRYLDDFRCDELPVRDLQHADGAVRLTAAVGGRTRVEDGEACRIIRVKRDMRVPEHH